MLDDLMNGRTLGTRVQLQSVAREVPDLLAGRMNMGKRLVFFLCCSLNIPNGQCHNYYVLLMFH